MVRPTASRGRSGRWSRARRRERRAEERGRRGACGAPTSSAWPPARTCTARGTFAIESAEGIARAAARCQTAAQAFSRSSTSHACAATTGRGQEARRAPRVLRPELALRVGEGGGDLVRQPRAELAVEVAELAERLPPLSAIDLQRFGDLRA